MPAAAAADERRQRCLYNRHAGMISTVVVSRLMATCTGWMLGVQYLNKHMHAQEQLLYTELSQPDNSQVRIHKPRSHDHD
jgi:hypothetical protein